MNAVAAEALIERAGQALIEATTAPAKVILFGSRARGDNDDRSMPTTLTGQNGAVVKQSTRVTVAGCAKHKKLKQPKPTRRGH